MDGEGWRGAAHNQLALRAVHSMSKDCLVEGVAAVRATTHALIHVTADLYAPASCCPLLGVTPSPLSPAPAPDVTHNNPHRRCKLR